MAALDDDDYAELLKLRQERKDFDKIMKKAVDEAVAKERSDFENQLARAREEGRSTAMSMLREMKSLLA